MAKKTEKAIIERLKHIETFYEKPPPGTVKEHEDKPEDCIPDTDGNRKAREFLAKAPSKGLWMPLGQEVKVMQCWKCKNYGHRTGDKECPLFSSGNAAIEKFREMYEDPMYSVLNSETRKKQDDKLSFLQQILENSSTDSEKEDEKVKKSKKKKKKKKHKNQWIEKKIDTDSDKKPKKHKHQKSSKSLSKREKSKKSNSDSDSDSRRIDRKSKRRHSKDSDYEEKQKKHKKHVK